MDPRQIRARHLIRDKGELFRLNRRNVRTATRCRVPSQRLEGVYYSVELREVGRRTRAGVRKGAADCTGPDQQFRHPMGGCKHMRATNIFMGRQLRL